MPNWCYNILLYDLTTTVCFSFVSPMSNVYNLLLTNTVLTVLHYLYAFLYVQLVQMTTTVMRRMHKEWYPLTVNFKVGVTLKFSVRCCMHECRYISVCRHHCRYMSTECNLLLIFPVQIVLTENTIWPHCLNMTISGVFKCLLNSFASEHQHW